MLPMTGGEQQPEWLGGVLARHRRDRQPGYLLYPYRQSSDKNRVRLQFAVLALRPWIEARGPSRATVAGSAESWFQQTECLLEAPSLPRHCEYGSASCSSRPRRWSAPRSVGLHPVDELRLADADYLSFEEAVPQEIDAFTTVGEVLGGERLVEIEVQVARTRRPLWIPRAPRWDGWSGAVGR